MIVIPAAGEGRRFREAGYEGPKHLLPLAGTPMIDRVVSNVRPLDSGRVVVADRHLVGETRGAVDTVLKAGIYPHQPLVVANCDQLIVLPDRVPEGNVVFTFRSGSPAHSYVITDPEDRITEIREKVVISNRAVSGVYKFDRAEPFLEACEQVVDSEDGELYISSALKRMIAAGITLVACDVPTAILGTPEDFQRFEVAALCAS